VEFLVGDTGAIECLPVGPPNLCTAEIRFSARGFPSGTRFRIAAREFDPASGTHAATWSISNATMSDGTAGAPLFDASVFTTLAAGTEMGTVTLQVIVLTFAESPAELPPEVELLSDTGADSAFVAVTDVSI